MDKEKNTEKQNKVTVAKDIKPKTVADVLAEDKTFASIANNPINKFARQVADITRPVDALKASMPKGIDSQLSSVSQLSKQISKPGDAWKAVALAQPKGLSRIRSQILPRDFAEVEKSLEKIDKESLRALRERLKDAPLHDYDESDKNEKLRNDLDDALNKFLKYINKFEDLNDEHRRQIALKEAELALEHQNIKNKIEQQEAEAKLNAKYDWREKWRHLFIRSLGTALFISTLLFVGWLVKNYEWAQLPYSSLFKSVVPFPVK